MHENQAAPKSPLPRYALQNAPNWFWLLAMGVLALMVTGVLTNTFLYPHYLPSHEWLRACEPYATLAGAAAAFLCTSLPFLSFRNLKRMSSERQNRLFETAILITCLYMFYFPGADLIRRWAPAIVALATGDRVEHAFVIEKADGPGGKFCRGEVKMREMPYPARLCAMPESFRAQLSPGMPVTFIGTGTWMGLFVEEIRTP